MTASFFPTLQTHLRNTKLNLTDWVRRTRGLRARMCVCVRACAKGKGLSFPFPPFFVRFLYECVTALASILNQVRLRTAPDNRARFR